MNGVDLKRKNMLEYSFTRYVETKKYIVIIAAH